MRKEDKSSRILSFITHNDWLTGDLRCSFLAAGEYNENYHISTGTADYVFRINHGTQLGLANQIEYEFGVLEAVAPSGVTPRPFHYSLDGGGLGAGCLLMEYIPGRALDYATDLHTAARIFARIHALPADPLLIVQADPVAAITGESLGLLGRFTGGPYARVKDRLLAYREELLAQAATDLFAGEPLCMVNTEVNSGNFIIGPERSCLVDWEKAVVSCRYQDLAHFLVATTTLWKTDCRLDDERKMAFLSTYQQALGLDITLTELAEKTRFMERVILLRALSWCWMAWHEYSGGGRVLTNAATFRKIVAYLDEAECFLS